MGRENILVGEVGSRGCADGGWCRELVGEWWGWLDGADVIGRHHGTQLLGGIPLLSGFALLGLCHSLRSWSWSGGRGRCRGVTEDASSKLRGTRLCADEVEVL